MWELRSIITCTVLCAILALGYFLWYYVISPHYRSVLARPLVHLRVRLLLLVNSLQSFRGRLVHRFEQSHLGSKLHRILRDHFSFLGTIVIYFFLAIHYYPSFFDSLRLMAFALLHLTILRSLNYNLRPLAAVPSPDLGHVYYASTLMMYISCFILLSFFFCWSLLLVPENYFTSVILDVNLKRLLLGSYALGVLLWISVGTIQNLAPVPPKPFGDRVPNPRFINKAMHVGRNRSFWGKNYAFMGLLCFSIIYLQGAGSFCRIAGCYEWWVNSPFIWVKWFICIFIVLAFCQHSLKCFIFAWFMQKRYYEKYKAQDDALYKQQQEDLHREKGHA